MLVLYLALIRQNHHVRYKQWLPMWLSGKESTLSAGEEGLIPGLGRSPGEGNGYLLQYSGLKKDRV